MSEQPNSQVRGQGDARAASSKRPEGYEPPTLTVLGSFAELTGQNLKISGNADLVNFVSAA